MKLSKQLLIALTSMICLHTAQAQDWTNPNMAVWYMNKVQQEQGVNMVVLGQIQNEIQVREWAIANQRTYTPTANALAWKHMRLSDRERATVQANFPEMLK
jgi:opacity protein-like surface antigen